MRRGLTLSALTACVAALAATAPVAAQTPDDPPTEVIYIIPEGAFGDVPLPQYLYNRRHPSPGYIYGGVIDPFSMQRHHGPGNGNFHQYGGVYRHHGLGHAYYDTQNVWRFHGLGGGGAYRKGSYRNRNFSRQRYHHNHGRYGINNYPWLNDPVPSQRRSAPGLPIELREFRPPQPPAERSEPVRPRPVNEWVRVFDENGHLVKRIKPRDIDREGWDMLGAGRDDDAATLFALQALNHAQDGIPRLGYALACALRGDDTKAAWSLRQALAHDPHAFGVAPLDDALLDRLTPVLERYAAAEPTDDLRLLAAAMHHLRAEDTEALAMLETVDEPDADALKQLRNLIDTAIGETAVAEGGE